MNNEIVEAFVHANISKDTKELARIYIDLMKKYTINDLRIFRQHHLSRFVRIWNKKTIKMQLKMLAATRQFKNLRWIDHKEYEQEFIVMLELERQTSMLQKILNNKTYLLPFIVSSPENKQLISNIQQIYDKIKICLNGENACKP